MSTSDTLNISETTTAHPRYDAYKDSGVEWLGEIPEHWEVERLKHRASVYLSSVDKKSEDAEMPVRLCNYTDVYYGSGIDNASGFMEATATPAEIAVHRLRKGDVLITKDSESADDIAVPAVATRNFEDVVCGYHLAQIRPSERLDGRFLYHAFLDPLSNSQFEVAATGITRFGIGASDIKNACFAFPPLPEQRAIAAYLDRETERIDTLVAKKERLIELLEEKRTALISHAVTKGLDADAEMKDSGVEWLGKIPAGWEAERLKHRASVYLSSVDKKSEDVEMPVRLCNYTDVYYGSGIDDASGFMEATATLAEIAVHRLRKGDVLITKDSESADDIAVPAVAMRDFEDVVCGYHLAQIRPSERLDGRFLYYAFLDPLSNSQFEVAATGITRFGIGAGDVKNACFAFPPLPEQRAIAAYLDRETERIDALEDKIRDGIDRLKEYRTALISAAVTGQIDARGMA